MSFSPFFTPPLNILAKAKFLIVTFLLLPLLLFGFRLVFPKALELLLKDQ